VTILVGVYCQDGVIIGADGSATFAAGQMRTIEQPTQKIEIIDGTCILAGSGEIGLGQRMAPIVANNMRQGAFRKRTPTDMMTELSNLVLQDFGRSFIKHEQVPFGALLAFFTGGQHHLCEFQLHNMRPELKTDKLWYVSMGSGQLIVDPFLALIREIYWEEGLPKKQDATFLVMWALEHVINCNAGGINEPIQIAELSTDDKGQPRARLLNHDELQEHRQNVADAINHMRSYRAKLKGEPAATVAEVPKPAAPVAIPDVPKPEPAAANSAEPAAPKQPVSTK